ncbi:MAG: TolC family protein [Acidobacteriota bacterium]
MKRSSVLKSSLVVVLAATLAGCMVGPRYQKPVVNLPDQYRGATSQNDGDTSLAETKWDSLFNEPVLRQLVSTALTQNFDLQIAAERVQQTRAQFRHSEGEPFPLYQRSGAMECDTRLFGRKACPLSKKVRILSFRLHAGGHRATWELDLWGRIRRLNQSAKAQYLAAEENQLGVRMSLVADVMNAYFLLLEQDRELAIGIQTRDIARDGLRLTTLRRDQGVATGLDVRQAEAVYCTRRRRKSRRRSETSAKPKMR